MEIERSLVKPDVEFRTRVIMLVFLLQHGIDLTLVTQAKGSSEHFIE